MAASRRDSAPLRRVRYAAPVAMLMACVAITAPITAPATMAAETGPWLTALAPGSLYDMSFERFSGDGQHLYASAVADPLTDTQPAGVWDLGSYDFDRLSPADSAAMFAGASADGSVALYATAVAIDPTDEDAAYDLYLVKAGQPDRLVTVGTASPVTSATWVADGGDLIIFGTPEAITVDDTGGNDLDFYIWDAATGSIRLLSAMPDASPVGFDPGGQRILIGLPDGKLYDWVDGMTTFLATGTFMGMSADTTRVYLVSSAQLLPNDTDQSNDAYMLDGDGIHLLSPDQTADVDLAAVSADGDRWILSSEAPLLPTDHDARTDNYLVEGGTLHVLPSGDDHAWIVGTSADLSIVVYKTNSQLVPEDADQGEDLYRWDAAAPSAVTLLTSGSSGFTPVFEGMSQDGGRVIIETPESLTPEAPESALSDTDVYEWFDGVITNLSPNSPKPVTVRGVSDDGRRVAFTTSANLVPEDRTGGTDLYLSDRVMQPPAEPARDVRPPSGSFSIAGGAALVVSPSVTLSVPATDARGFVVSVSISNTNGTKFFEYPYQPEIPWTLSAGDGTKTVYVKWTDSANNDSDVVSSTVVLDTIAPTVTDITRSFKSGSTVAIDGRVVLHLAWAGADSGSGILRYDLEKRLDSGPWQPLGSQASTSRDVTVTPQHAYAFRVRATDKAGLQSGWTAGASAAVTKYSEFNARIRYRGTWVTAKHPSYLGGAVKRASIAGKTASLTFTGRSFGWVAAVGPTRGRASIYVDGSKVATVDLWSASAHARRLAFSKTWTTTKTRTVTIYVQGTPGRGRVDVDALVAGG